MTTTQLTCHVTAIDSSLAGPGDGCRLLTLRTSGEFWDADPADERVAEEEFRAELTALNGLLSLRWGEPEVIDLTPHLERAAMGLPVRPPLADLSALATTLHTWTVGESWVATALGRAGPCLPYELVAAVRPGGAGSAIPRRTPPRGAGRTPPPGW
ncbi:hypothetical protein ABT381_02120 [Streptomyces sp. NPDC000151]|uniref:hypothetical protein n=1 Tax=Streptomyces sp. NPDC000151 TaxID=3154244 RepID=UPI003328D204